MTDFIHPVASRQLQVSVYVNRETTGQAAAYFTAQTIRALLEKELYINMVFAAAPSQNEFLSALVDLPDIEWNRIRAFHLDEYIGLPKDAPQRFASYLYKHIFNRVTFKEVHYLDNGDGINPEEICARYSALLEKYPLHIACIGIGETGHIAFNDPSVADFHDPNKVKIVRLEEGSRQQQVNDGCFPSLEDVPTHAITLTIPTIMSAQKIVCVVPGSRKRMAIERSLEGPITTECPASILRRHPDVAMFLDKESASSLLRK